MRTLTPKQRELRHREDRILAVASPLIRDGGIGSVSIGQIAKAMNYTRGTIYNHFPHKEDILVSLASRAVGRRIRLFELAIESQSLTRDRIAAVGLAAEVYVDTMPDDFAVEQIIRHEPVWRKSSEARRQVLSQCETRCIGLVGGVVRDAIESGDLVVSRPATVDETVQHIVFGLWSLVYGGLVLQATSPSLRVSGIDDPRQTIRRNCNRLLDHFGWQPLHDARRYHALIRRVVPRLNAAAVDIGAGPATDIGAGPATDIGADPAVGAAE